MLNKKGLSPLIATVLLIAFAVALGAMIMNWSSDMGPIEAPGGESTNPCDNVEIQLSKAFGQTIFCYEDGMIRFNIENTGTKEILGIQLRTVDENLKPIERDLPSSKVSVGGTFSEEFEFDKSGKVHVELVPMIRGETSTQYCPKKKIVQDVLPNCANE